VNRDPQMLWGLKRASIIKVTLSDEIRKKELLRLPSVSCLGKCE